MIEVRIAVDMQFLQTEKRFSNIGRLIASVCKAFIKLQEQKGYEIIFVINDLLENKIGSVLSNNGSHYKQHTFYPPRSTHEKWWKRISEKIYEASIASLTPEVIHIFDFPPLRGESTVLSMGQFNTATPASVFLTDADGIIYSNIFSSSVKPSILFAVDEKFLDKVNYNCPKVVLPLCVSDTFGTLPYKDEDIQKLGLKRSFILCITSSKRILSFATLKNLWDELPLQIKNNYSMLATDIVSTVHVIDSDISFSLSRMLDEQELNLLYNSCSLLIYLPHDGDICLPVLEALACGSMVVTDAKNVPILNEYIIKVDKHQDIPSAVSRILLGNGLPSRELRLKIAEHIKSRYSPIRTAELILENIESTRESNQKKSIPCAVKQRPKMAYISPLPPEESGISYYSAELLPELSKYYDIEVVTRKKEISDEWIRSNLPIRSIKYFQRNASSYERIIYHFGNSHFHSHMFDLLQDCPGVVVLHDFFLSDVIAYEEIINGKNGIWTETLYYSHGYHAVKTRFMENGIDRAKILYPLNLSILQKGYGIITHSLFPKQLFNKFYKSWNNLLWAVIPHLRKPVEDIDKVSARSKLKISSEAVLVCCFGVMGHTKQNDRLLEAWLRSELSSNEKCYLVFVGHGGEYGRRLLDSIRREDCKGRISITGWVDEETFRLYLSSCDIAVQLRTNSRGETSGTVLDCMNYGVPTIINAHGSMADVPDEAVWKLPDQFTNEELVNALETLVKDEELRRHLSIRAREAVRVNHAPAKCAEQYTEAIEFFYRQSKVGKYALIKDIALTKDLPGHDDTLKDVAISVESSVPYPVFNQQILVDVSSVSEFDLRTGIERVVRAQVINLIENTPEGFRVEPVYLSNRDGKWQYWYAREYTSRLLGFDQFYSFEDTPVEVRSGDILYVPDLCRDKVITASYEGLYSALKRVGVSINFLVHDILPILHPEFFPEGDDIAHTEWLSQLTKYADSIICVSGSTANSLKNWLAQNPPIRDTKLKVYVLHNGSDIESSGITKGLPRGYEETLAKIRSKLSFLMVGTIEPRKGHLQVISAFDLLWSKGYDINLVIVGKEGWKGLPESKRRTIPWIVSAIKNHREYQRRLIWLNDVTDEYLEKIYESCKCFIAASEDEGFGLPIVEAAKRNLPIISRDIPVFREIAGEHAFYFNGTDAMSLATSIVEWINSYKLGRHPRPNGIKYLTWRDNVRSLLDILFGKALPYEVIDADGGIKAGDELTYLSNKIKFIGWSKPEKGFRWSLGRECLLEFKLDSSSSPISNLFLIFDTFGKQRIRISLNNVKLIEHVMDGTNLHINLCFPPLVLRSFYPNTIRFDLPDARCPGNGDSRTLAVALKKIVLK